MWPPWFPVDQIPDLKEYQNFHKISEGGFGEVYSATLNRGPQTEEVIIKRLKPLYVKDSTAREILENDARTLKQLKHPKIPRYYDGYLSDSECFFIMERIPGPSASQLVQVAKASHRSLSPDLAFEIIWQTSEVLEYLHHFQNKNEEAMPLLHCDIKPDNILITPQLHCYLIDYSVVTSLPVTKPHLGGTLAYMPPERLGGQPMTFQVDLFGLNLSFYFLLTFRRIFSPMGMTELLGRWLRRDQEKEIRQSKLSPPLQEYFLKNLALEPEGRCQDVGELKKDLMELARNLDLERDRNKLVQHLIPLLSIS